MNIDIVNNHVNPCWINQLEEMVEMHDEDTNFYT